MSATALLAASIVGNSLSQFQQGQFNKEVGERQAASIRQSNQLNRGIRERDLRRVLGENRAKTFAAGVEFSGSPMLMEISNIFEFESEERAIGFNTEVQARQAEAGASLAAFRGISALGRGALQAGSVLLDEDG